MHFFIKRYAGLAIIMLFICVAAARLFFPDLSHGDEYSDANVLTAGKNFNTFGFRATCFLPCFDGHSARPEVVYSHYPPLPDIINGVIRRLMHTDALVVFRTFAIAASGVGLLFWFMFIRLVSGSLGLGYLAVLFLLCNPNWLYGIDSLHQLAYSDMIRSAVLYFAARVFIKRDNPALDTDAGRPDRTALVLLGISLFAGSWVSFEYIVYSSVFLALFWKKICPEGIAWGRLAVGSIAVSGTGVLAHFAQNVCFFGSVPAAFKDLAGSAVQRIANSSDSFAPLNISTWFQFALWRNIQANTVIDLVAVFLLAALAVIVYRHIDVPSRFRIRSTAYVCGVLFVSGITWYFIFPAHSLAHAFIGFLPRHLAPASALFFALCCYSLFKYAGTVSAWGKKSVAVVILFVAFLCSAGIVGSQLPVTGAGIASEVDFRNAVDCLKYLRSESAPSSVIGVNYYRFPFIRYYLDRNVVPVMDAESLEALPALPEYFLFMPYDNDVFRVLFGKLDEKYEIVSRCRSQRFPFVVFKLKP